MINFSIDVASLSYRCQRLDHIRAVHIRIQITYRCGKFLGFGFAPHELLHIHRVTVLLTPMVVLDVFLDCAGSIFVHLRSKGMKNITVFVTRSAFFTFGISILFLVIGALVSSDSFFQTVWMDRDLWRASQFDPLITVTGPESDTGARAPGGSFYALLKLALSIHSDPVAANVLRNLMFSASIVVLFGYMAVNWRWPLACLATAIYASSGTLLQASVFWNPGYIPLFAVLMVIAMHRYFKTRGSAPLFALFFLFALSSQIHQQTIILMLGFILTLALYRIRPRWADGFAALWGFLIAYAPFLAHELPDGFAHTRDLLHRLVYSPYVGSEEFFEFTAPKFALIQRLLSSSAHIYQEMGGAVGVVGTYFLLPLDVLVLIVTLAFVGFVAIGASRGFLSRHPSPIAVEEGFTAVIFLAFVLILFKSGHLLLRHLVAITPVVSMLSAFAFTRAIEAVPGLNRHFRRLVLAVLIGAFAGRCLFIGTINTFSNVSVTPTRYHGMTELTKTFAKVYGWNFEHVESYVSSFRFYGGKFHPQNPTFGSFFNILSIPSKRDARDATCVIVVAKSETGDLKLKEMYRAFQRHALLVPYTPKFHGFKTSDNFFFLEYNGQDGNCFKSATNAYIDGPLEKSLSMGALPLAAPLRSSVEEIPNSSLAPQTVGFAIRIPKSRIPIGVLLQVEGGKIVPTIIGRELQGYTGIPSSTLYKPKILFQPSAGERQIASTFVTQIGGGKKWGSLAPWRLSPTTLSAGSWHVSFSGQLDNLSFFHELGTIFIETHGHKQNIRVDKAGQK